MTKNAYEIRLEVLKMAQEMMDKQYSEASNLYWSALQSNVELFNVSLEETMKTTKLSAPVMYTPKEIMDKAQELYGFISKG